MKKRLVPALSSIGQRVCNPLAVVLTNMFQGTGPVTENMKSSCSGPSPFRVNPPLFRFFSRHRVKFVSFLLLVLPLELFIAVYRLNPDYVNLLFTDEMGRKMLATGIVMQILGALVIRKIVNIRV